LKVLKEWVFASRASCNSSKTSSASQVKGEQVNSTPSTAAYNIKTSIASVTKKNYF